MERDALQHFLNVVEPSRRCQVLDLSIFPGGYSRETFLAEVRWDDGATERFVLRSDPPGDQAVFRSDRDREWKVLTALDTGTDVRIAKPRYFDATGEYLGAPCIVSEYVKAPSFQSELQGLPDLEQARDQFIDMVARVHRAPLDSVEKAIGAPASWDQHIDSLLAVFERMLANLAAVGQSDPLLRYVLLKLRANLPAPVPLSLVHGDCQPGNFLVPADEEPVVIDWEFAEVGDPRQDLGYYLVIPMPPHLYHGDPEAFCAGYREATGLTAEQVNPQAVSCFLMLGQGRLFQMELDAAEAIARGESRGALGLYLVGAIPDVRRNYFEASRSLPMPEVTS